MSRPQPYRIDWTIEPQSLPEAHQRLGTQFESIDQMFQMLFEDLQRASELTSGASGILPVINGGTNFTGPVTTGGVAYGVTGNKFGFTASGVSGQALLSAGTGTPVFGLLGLVTGITGILPLANGGTNASGAAVTGGVIYSDATKWLATVAGTSGQSLLSAGTAAPAFGLVGLVTGVTGILPLTLGGTNATGAAVTGGVVYSDATKWLATTVGTAGHFLMSSGTAAPTFAQIDLTTTGVSGVLTVPNGGTGLATLATGAVPYGSGVSPLNSTGSFNFDGTLLAIPGQIGFPATQAASTGVNVLDDYEEGEWTPAIGGSSGQSGQVHAGQHGYYTKIGDQVTVYARVALSTLGTITGAVQIQGLPFTAKNVTNLRCIGAMNWSNTTTAFSNIFSQVIETGTAITLLGVTAAATGTVGLLQADLSNTTVFAGSITYVAAT